jgi:DNA invertase Pin-like site-specific DNA recombinase
MTQVVGVFAERKRSLIAQRTRDALAAKKANRERLGRASARPTDVRTQAPAMREAGATYEAITDAMLADGIPTPIGGPRWTAPTAAARSRRLSWTRRRYSACRLHSISTYVELAA